MSRFAPKTLGNNMTHTRVTLPFNRVGSFKVASKSTISFEKEEIFADAAQNSMASSRHQPSLLNPFNLAIDLHKLRNTHDSHRYMSQDCNRPQSTRFQRSSSLKVFPDMKNGMALSSGSGALDNQLVSPTLHWAPTLTPKDSKTQKWLPLPELCRNL